MFQWFSFGEREDFVGKLLWLLGIFYFRDALFEFTNVFCDRGKVGRWGSDRGSVLSGSSCSSPSSSSVAHGVALGVLLSPSACCSGS